MRINPLRSRYQSKLNTNMQSSPTGCCALQWAMWKGGGLTSRDRLNSSENYLLLGCLLAMQSQTVLLLVRQSVTLDNYSISQSPNPPSPPPTTTTCWDPLVDTFHKHCLGNFLGHFLFILFVDMFLDTFCRHFCEDFYFLTHFTNTFCG